MQSALHSPLGLRRGWYPCSWLHKGTLSDQVGHTTTDLQRSAPLLPQLQPTSPTVANPRAVGLAAAGPAPPRVTAAVSHMFHALPSLTAFLGVVAGTASWLPASGKHHSSQPVRACPKLPRCAPHTWPAISVGCQPAHSRRFQGPRQLQQLCNEPQPRPR